MYGTVYVGARLLELLSAAVRTPSAAATSGWPSVVRIVVGGRPQVPGTTSVSTSGQSAGCAVGRGWTVNWADSRYPTGSGFQQHDHQDDDEGNRHHREKSQEQQKPGTRRLGGAAFERAIDDSLTVFGARGPDHLVGLGTGLGDGIGARPHGRGHIRLDGHRIGALLLLAADVRAHGESDVVVGVTHERDVLAFEGPQVVLPASG